MGASRMKLQSMPLRLGAFQTGSGGYISGDIQLDCSPQAAADPNEQGIRGAVPEGVPIYQLFLISPEE